MRAKLFIPLVVIGCGVAISASVVGLALAQTGTSGAVGPTSALNIQYPVAELGNCASQADCKAYCDIPTHLEACIAFAKKNNLMSPGDIDAAQKFLAAGGKGPGRCTSQESCQTYCNDISHINECVSFAKKTGILPPEQLRQAEQVQAAIAKGVKPPPCKDKQECDIYCSKPANMKVCVAFGEAAGFLTGTDLANAKKVVAAIDAGAAPPPCDGKDACDAYCSQPEHMEACMTFAQAAGLMTPQEMQNSQKVLQAIKNGAKPPACSGKDACDKYCAESEHFDECTNFAVAAGFMSEKDAEMARKTGGKGPGGCAGKDACDAFCNNPDNQQTCFNFAKDNGLISPEDLQKMQQGRQQFQQSFQNMPPEVLTCLQNLVGSDTLEKFKSGQIMPSQDIGQKMGQCFSQMGGPPGQGQGMAPGGSMGMPPISSMSPETQNCIKSAIGPDAFQQLQSGPTKNGGEAGLFDKVKNCFGLNPQQQGFPRGMAPGTGFASGTGPNMPPQGGMPPPGFQNNFPGGPASGTTIVGPGGCKTPQECAVFCANNPQICNNFQPPPPGQQGQMQPMMPPQGMAPGTGFASGTGPNMPPQGGMPLNPTMPLNGTMPPPSGTQQMIPQGEMQPFAPPPPAPGTTSTTSGLQNRGFLGTLIELFRPMFGL